MKKSASLRPISPARSLNKPASATARIVQPGTTAGAPKPKTAPPAYRPQAIPKVLQKKEVRSHLPPSIQAQREPVAPPVYSPHPTPKVLQTKKAASQSNAQTRHAQVFSTPVQLQKGQQVTAKNISSRPSGSSPNKGGQAIQRTVLGTCRVTVHRKQQSTENIRGVIQPKKVVVTLVFKQKRITFHLEVNEDGTITGTDLRRAVIVGFEPRLLDNAARLTVNMGKTEIKDDATNYEPKELETFTILFDDLRAAAEERDAQGVDQTLIQLARNSNRCVIGCYLLSRPGDPEELIRQQCLKELLTAIQQNKSLTVVLIDPNFGKETDVGQVVDYLQKNHAVQTVSQTAGDITTYTVTTVGDQRVSAVILIKYVGKLVNGPTGEEMKQQRIGKWYSE